MGKKVKKLSVVEFRALLRTIADDQKALTLVVNFITLLAKRSRRRSKIHSE